MGEIGDVQIFFLATFRIVILNTPRLCEYGLQPFWGGIVAGSSGDSSVSQHSGKLSREAVSGAVPLDTRLTKGC